FIGYTALMTLVLVAMTSLCLVYFLVPGIVHPAAAAETERARVPIYGELEFKGLPNPRGVDLGDEWKYRGYLPGGPASDAWAVWHIPQLPTRLDERLAVPCEFAFNVRRMTRAEEDRGASCTLIFETWRCNEAHKLQFDQERSRLLR